MLQRGFPFLLAVALGATPSAARAQQIVHTFQPPPAFPYGGLVEGLDGRLYGTTTQGGAIYRLAAGGSGPAQILRAGVGATSALVRGSDGALYGTTPYGGIDDRGTVFRFDPATQRFDTVHAFIGDPGAWSPIGPLLSASDGLLYGVAQQGGAGALYSVEPATGRTLTLHTFQPMDPTGEGPIGGLVEGADGGLYGVMKTGGAGVGGTIYRFDRATRTVAVAHAFSPPISAPSASLTRASDGALYGVSASGGPGGHSAVFRFVPGSASLEIVHAFDPSAGGDGSQLETGVTVAADGSVWGMAVALADDIVFQIRRQGPGSYSYALRARLSPAVHGVHAVAGLALANDGWLYGAMTVDGPAAGGTVLRVDSLLRGPVGDEAQPDMVHAFRVDGAGWSMRHPPTAFTDGFLYGLTSEGSASGDGDVYRLNPLTGETTVLGTLPAGTAQRGDTMWASRLVDGGDGSLYALALQTFGTGGYIVRVTPSTNAVTLAQTFTRSGAAGALTSGLARVGAALYGLVETPGGMGLFRFSPGSAAFAIVATVTPTTGLRGTLSAGLDGRLLVSTTAGPLMPPRDGVLYRVDAATGAVVLLASAPGVLDVVEPLQASATTIYFLGAESHLRPRILSVDPATGVVTTGCVLGRTGFVTALSLTPAGGLTVVFRDDRSTVELLDCAFNPLQPSTGISWNANVDGSPTALATAPGGVVYGGRSNGDIYRFGTSGSGPPLLDTDGDGLDNAWESAWGLDPRSAAGGDGATGDPDGDGRSNALEQAQATHPHAFVTRYLAEGAANAFFDTRIAIANPGDSPAHVLVRFAGAAGAFLRIPVIVPARSRRTIGTELPRALGVFSFSTVIESDAPITVDRTMRWDASGYGSHMERAVEGPSTTWYLAEGSTSGDFSLFYLLQNAQPTAVTATVRYLRPSGQPPVERVHTLPPNSRTTIAVDGQGPELASTDLSAVITASAPIIVERAMYTDRPGQPFAAGHASAGVTAPALEWFLAEGATGPFFDLFVLIANPSPTPAAVTVDYLLLGGGVLTKSYTVPGNGRYTIWVDDEALPAGSGERPLRNVAVSMTVRSTNGVPIIVERTMWWPGPELSANFWYEAHNSPGATAPALRWSVADGDVGGPDGADTYVLIANTAPRPGTVRVRLFFENGNTSGRIYAVPANSRTNVALGADFEEAAANGRMAVLVESLGENPVPIVVEHASYASPGGITWASGSNALAVPVP